MLRFIFIRIAVDVQFYCVHRILHWRKVYSMVRAATHMGLEPHAEVHSQHGTGISWYQHMQRCTLTQYFGPREDKATVSYQLLVFFALTETSKTILLCGVNC